MSRTLSTTGYQAITAADTDAVFVHLLEINTTDSPQTTTRIANNSETLIYGGNVYTAFPFSIVLPSDESGQISEARVVIDNVSRLLVDEIRTLTNTLAINIYVVDASQTPVTLEASYSGFTLKNVIYDALTLQGRLSAEDFLAEPFPKDVLSGANYPGLF